MTDQNAKLQLQGTLHILSPTCVSSTRPAEPIEYYSDGEMLHRLDMEKLYGVLPPEVAGTLSAWINAKIEDIRAQRQNMRAQNQLRKQLTLKEFAKDNPDSEMLVFGAAREAGVCTLKGMPPDLPAVQMDLAPDDRRPCVSSSALHGMIRAGLAYMMLNDFGTQLIPFITEGLPDTDLLPLKTARNAGQASETVQRVLFHCGRRQDDKVLYRFRDLDLMQAVQCLPAKTDQRQLTLARFYMSSPAENRRGGIRPGLSYYELFDPGQQLPIEIVIDLSQLLDVEETRFEWIDIDTRFRLMVGIGRGQGEPAELCLAFIQRALDGLCRIAEDMVAVDLEWARQVGTSGEAMPGFVGFHQQLASAKTVLRPGWPGLELVRLFELYLQRHHQEVYATLREKFDELRPKGGIGGDPPACRRLLKTGQELWPMNWCRLELVGLEPNNPFQIPTVEPMPEALEQPLREGGYEPRPRRDDGGGDRRPPRHDRGDGSERPRREHQGDRPPRDRGDRPERSGRPSRPRPAGSGKKDGPVRTPWGDAPKQIRKHGKGKGSGASTKGKGKRSK